jgi:cytochrome P450
MPANQIPPGPPGKLLTGHASEFHKDRLGTLTKNARKYGDLVSFRVGPIKGVMVCHPEHIEEVLVKHKDLAKDQMSNLLRPATGDGIFLSEGEKWKKQRRMVTPPFHKEKIAGYGEVMVDMAAELTRTIPEGTRDIVPDITRMALAIAAKTLFSADVGSDEGKKVSDAMTAVMNSVGDLMNSPFPMPPVVPTKINRQLKSAVADLDKILYGFIAKRRADPEAHDDLLSLLLQAADHEGDGTGMTDQEVRDEAMTIFLAGFETTSLTLAWVLWLLAKHPEEQEKVREECRTLLGDRRASAADMRSLKYTEHVISESMRLYPPVVMVGRVAHEDIDLGGFKIKKGTALWPCEWVAHRDPRWWPNPDEFIPSRWENDLHKHIPKYAYFPFGGGPHMCAGNAYAMMEMVLALATLVRGLKFEPVPGGDPTPLPGFTLRPAPGVTLRITKIV